MEKKLKRKKHEEHVSKDTPLTLRLLIRILFSLVSFPWSLFSTFSSISFCLLFHVYFIFSSFLFSLFLFVFDYFLYFLFIYKVIISSLSEFDCCFLPTPSCFTHSYYLYFLYIFFSFFYGNIINNFFFPKYKEKN